ncbi:MAG TPA: YetF domain-containing protein [Gemmatimonadota bacterium]|jgi:uncharacterized membrane protein YcaP (DUF421 family)
MTELLDALRGALGLDEPRLGAGHMALRAVVVFVFAVALVRLGNRRFLGRSTAFDLVLGFMLGSVLSRAITGNAPFGPTLVAGGALVGLHWLLSAVAFHSHRFGVLVKGQPRDIVKDGAPDAAEMRRAHLTRRDLLEALRLGAGIDDPHVVQRAVLERNGEVSVLRRRAEPRVVEVDVRDGVQRLRIELA